MWSRNPNKTNSMITLCKARRRGLVVMVKIHIQEVMGSNPGPAVETIYHAPLIWIKSMKAKIVEKITWHCCMCCNPAKGRVEFEDNWLIKSSFKTMDEMKACQLIRTKLKKMITLFKLIISKYSSCLFVKVAMVQLCTQKKLIVSFIHQFLFIRHSISTVSCKLR